MSGPKVVPVPRKPAPPPAVSTPPATSTPKPVVQQQQVQQPQQQLQDISRKINNTSSSSSVMTPVDGSANLSSTFEESALLSASEALLDLPGAADARVFVRCNYCPTFRSVLNGDTWESILNHILPVCKEELHTTFYGDLAKHFIRRFVHGHKSVEWIRLKCSHLLPSSKRVF